MLNLDVTPLPSLENNILPYSILLNPQLDCFANEILLEYFSKHLPGYVSQPSKQILKVNNRNTGMYEIYLKLILKTVGRDQ